MVSALVSKLRANHVIQLRFFFLMFFLKTGLPSGCGGTHLQSRARDAEADRGL